VRGNLYFAIGFCWCWEGVSFFGFALWDVLGGFFYFGTIVFLCGVLMDFLFFCLLPVLSFVLFCVSGARLLGS